MFVFVFSLLLACSACDSQLGAAPQGHATPSPCLCETVCMVAIGLKQGQGYCSLPLISPTSFFDHTCCYLDPQPLGFEMGDVP